MRTLITGLTLAATFWGTSTSAQTDFETKVMEAIIANPEVVLLAIEKLREREEASAAVAQAQRIKSHEAELFPDGNTRLVKFIDYRCGYCAQSAASLATLSPEELDQIRFVEFPILGAASREIAEVALAVREIAGEGAYHTFHFAVFDADGRVTGRETALNLAQDFGHNRGDVAKIAASSFIDETINRNRVLARALEISGTPAFVSRETIHEGLMSLPDLRGILNEGDVGE